MIARQSIALLLLVLGSLACFPANLHATPVIGWQIDTSFGGGFPGGIEPVLSSSGTNSPILGDGSANNADNTAIYAAFPLVSLANGQRITLSGSAQMIGTASNGDFRWGLFKNDGVGAPAAGWLGYIGSAESYVWSKDPSGDDFATATFASVASGRAVLLGTTDEPSGLLFNPGTYDFTMTVERYGNEIDTRIAIASSASGFSIVSPTFTETVPARLTFAFDRVGFLAGSALDADQLRFSGIDVSTSAIEAPTIEVHSSGQVFITNPTSQSVDLTQYEITSGAGALNEAEWSSLDDQENNDPLGVGWEEAGESDSNLLAEVNLLSMASLEPGERLRLGSAFTAGGVEDLALHYTSQGEVLRGIVTYEQSGDYNADGAVDAADYIVWRKQLGANVAFGSGADGDGDGTIQPTDHDVWRKHFAANSVADGAGGAAVPEPCVSILVLLALVATATQRRRA